MRKFGLIGYPLTHSFSQRYFTEKFTREGIPNCSYENFSIGDINLLPDLLKEQPDLNGFNITIPHKNAILPFLASMSDVVRQIKACNCVRRIGEWLHGYNTDVVGFEISLQNFLKDQPERALILGTGGSAKAVSWVLDKMGINSSLVSRNPSTGQLSYQMLTPELIRQHKLIVNTTPLGMYPVDQSPDIPYESLTSEHYLFDLLYNPAETLFMQKGAARGAKVKNGYEMLELQAEESWRIWNAPSP
jgi:shikimate dehydrogenase